GDLMQNVGGKLVKHYKDLAFMGFAEVVKNLPTILKNISFCKKDLLQFKPDAVIFIDYPGFNLRIAEFAKKNNLQTHYYISPQLWAWKENRIDKVKQFVDYMYVILPFEKEFYEEKHNYPVHFVGHPLIDAIANRKQVSGKVFKKEHNLSEKPIIALLPGSRKQEIKKMLSVMLKMADKFKDYQFVIAGAPSQPFQFYKQFITKNNVKFISNKTYDLLSISYAAIVTSGTATLETALFKVPQVVCYKTSFISYEIGKRVVNLDYISLVNLIMDKKVVTELIQNDFNEEKLAEELTKITSSPYREQLFLEYYELEKKLGGKGASKKVAELVIKKAETR
ncbi:MAG TPA: lipid-A-disaccharide synthase, partial [Flavobacteriaceae bacterium]|nr:lipid-A-disaccharide synthase [Flavobacteriaceae bacterium]